MRSPTTSARRSKKAAIISLLQRPDGAALGDLTAATGWQVHSVRAALTGLRKEGKELEHRPSAPEDRLSTGRYPKPLCGRALPGYRISGRAAPKPVVIGDR